MALSVAAFAAPVTAADAQVIASTSGGTPRYDASRVVIGVGVAQVPTYQGSSDYRTLPLPVIDIAVGQVFANLRNGVGLEVVSTEGFTFGGGLAPMPGYRRRDVPEGVDPLSFGAGARLFVNVKAGGAIVTVGGTRGIVGSTRGFVADASLSYPMVASRRLVLIPSIGTSWADEKHTDHYFGIAADEAIASGLPRYSPSGGFKDVSASLTASYRLSGRLNLTATGIVTSLLGDARQSPLVERKNQPSAILSLTYRLGS